MPTKKERSKQRKEAKAASESQRREERREAALAAIVASLRDDSAGGNRGGNSSVPNNRFRQSPFFSPLTAHIVRALNRPSRTESTTELFQRGSEWATQQIIHYEVLSDTKKNELVSITPTVLDFLKRCENETFEDTMVNIGGGTVSLNSGDLRSPSRWVKVIANITVLVPSCYMQIIENIGPLVRCMCNDTKRLFFKSNKHWIESIVPFIGFISRMIIRNNNPMSSGMITKLLLDNDDLTKSIVQWGFWEKYRPDIVKEICAEFDAIIFERIVELGRSVTQILVTDAIKPRDTNGRLTKERSEECKNRLDIIGTTPVINKDYDPSCMISYVSGLIHLIKSTKGKVSIGSNDESHLPRNYFITIQQLIGYADCIDKGVITELIDLGTNFVSDCYDAEALAESLSLAMVRKGTNVGKRQISDTRTAFAIRVGLIEMCLNFVGRFGTHESFIKSRGQQSLFSHIEHIFNSVFCISFHQKSRRAICVTRAEVIRTLESTNITNNVNNCQRLVNMVMHIKESEMGRCCILDLNASFCCRCNKALDRKRIKRCNGCNRMTYCSRACQKEDWSNGHKLTCCKTVTIETRGQFQGRLLPEEIPSDERSAAKLEELEMNITSIQLRLFFEGTETILKQAKVLNLPLCDLVVLFDLCICPPTVHALDYNEYFCDNPAEKKGYEASRSKDNITCVYRTYHSNVQSMSRSVNQKQNLCFGEGDCIMQRLYPHEWLNKAHVSTENNPVVAKSSPPVPQSVIVASAEEEVCVKDSSPIAKVCNEEEMDGFMDDLFQSFLQRTEIEQKIANMTPSQQRVFTERVHQAKDEFVSKMLKETDKMEGDRVITAFVVQKCINSLDSKPTVSPSPQAAQPSFTFTTVTEGEGISSFGHGAPPQAQAPLPSFAFGGSTDKSAGNNTFSLGTSATTSTGGASSRRRAAKKSARRK